MFTKLTTAALALLTLAAQARDPNADPWLVTINLNGLSESRLERMAERGITLNEGEQVRFQVLGNPTTGYEWTVNHDLLNGTFEVTRDYVMDEVPEEEDGMMWVGVGGTYYFTIEALAPLDSDEVGVF